MSGCYHAHTRGLFSCSDVFSVALSLVLVSFKCWERRRLAAARGLWQKFSAACGPIKKTDGLIDIQGFGGAPKPLNGPLCSSLCTAYKPSVPPSVLIPRSPDNTKPTNQHSCIFCSLFQVGKVSVSNGQALLAVSERGDWLTVIPIVVPVEVALQHLADLWDRFARDLGTYARLGKRTAEGETLGEHDPGNDAKVFESVVSTARVGPIAGGAGTAEEMWALRRQGDMLYLVSGGAKECCLVCVCLSICVSPVVVVVSRGDDCAMR